MHPPVLTLDERHCIEAGSWFSRLSPALREAIVACSTVRRLFGDIALFDGMPRTHDAHAHGATVLLVVRRADFKALLAEHVELYKALLRLNCRRLRLLFDTVEDLNTLPLSARLAKQILLLARSYGVAHGGEIRVDLQLAQEDTAQLLGASRQRVNQELKSFERDALSSLRPGRPHRGHSGLLAALPRFPIPR